MIDVDGGQLCYDILKSAEKGGHPIVYLPGLIRPKSEAKSLNLQAFCKKAGFTFLCADYFGNGRSSGKPTDGTVGRFVRDTIYLIDKVLGANNGKVVLVGHGVGAWVAFLIAMKRPDLVSGIVGMAADPDFTEELLWKKLPEDIKEKIMKEGVHEITWGNEKYPISKNLIEDGRNNLLLSGPPGMRVLLSVHLLSFPVFLFTFLLTDVVIIVRTTRYDCVSVITERTCFSFAVFFITPSLLVSSPILSSLSSSIFKVQSL